MTFFRTLESRPTITAFWFWVALNLLLWGVSVLDGSLLESMLLAVDYAVAQGSEPVMDRESSARSFIYISFAYFLAVTALGALVVHKSAAGRTWALALLVPLALWWAYESVSSPLKLEQMYPGTIEWSDWLVALLGGLVWVFILVYSARAHRRIAT